MGSLHSVSPTFGFCQYLSLIHCTHAHKQSGTKHCMTWVWNILQVACVDSSACTCYIVSLIMTDGLVACIYIDMATGRVNLDHTGFEDRASRFGFQYQMAGENVGSAVGLWNVASVAKVFRRSRLIITHTPVYCDLLIGCLTEVHDTGCC